MERINVTQAVRQFSDLINRVFYQGASYELERNNRVVARLSPAGPARGVKVGALNELFAGLPRLGEDADRFARDVEEARRGLPPEADPWG